MVDDFDRATKKFDKELEFFKEKTSTWVPDVVRKHLDIYFFSKGNQNPTFLNDSCDNKNQDIRLWFIEKTGYDIRIETAKYYLNRIIAGIML